MPGRVRHDMEVLERLQVELEGMVDRVRMLAGAPFTWITIVIRYSNGDAPPTWRRVDKRHGDLPLTVTIDMERVRKASYDDTYAVFRTASVEGLVAVARQFGLPSPDLDIGP